MWNGPINKFPFAFMEDFPWDTENINSFGFLVPDDYMCYLSSADAANHKEEIWELLEHRSPEAPPGPFSHKMDRWE